MEAVQISSLLVRTDPTHFVLKSKNHAHRDEAIHVLVQGCRQGQRHAERMLFDEMVPVLRAVARRYVWEDSYVEDVLQETFIRIFQNIEKFDSEKGSFVAWSSKVAAHCAIRFGQIQQRHKHEQLSAHHDKGQLPDVESFWAMDNIMDVLKQMPSSFRNVLMLYAIEGFRHEEIALMLDISRSTSRQRLSRARQWLSQRYQVDNGELIPNPKTDKS
jgi:RNA polymerase sigma-70 factor (ECF subfamily)